MDEVELQLQSEDHGKDLASVIHLLKRHALLEREVNGHIEAVKQVKDTAAAFQSSHHFMSDEIQERSVAAIRRSVMVVCCHNVVCCDVMCDWRYMKACWKCGSSGVGACILLPCLS
jgi:hypothetical protein